MSSPQSKYSLQLIWSEGDGCYLAQVRELPGCVADGATAEEAFQNMCAVMQEWLETAKEEGRPIPPPVTFEELGKNAAVAHQKLEQHIGQAVSQILAQVAQDQSPLGARETFARFDSDLEKAR